MIIFFHNLKVALRNLMKYKLQTLISVASIAIGIVTLAFAHSILKNVRMPILYEEPYGERTYQLKFNPIGGYSDNDDPTIPEGAERMRFTRINTDIMRAIKRDGGLRCAEKIAIPSGGSRYPKTEFHLTDSTIRKGQIEAKIYDPAYPNFAGFHSAITGEKIRMLKKGEAILSEELAKKIFQDKNPIGAVQTLTGYDQPIPVTIVDVFQTLSLYDMDKNPDSNDCMYYCLSDSVEDLDIEENIYAVIVNVALKEGFTKKQLRKEADERVKPLGLETEILDTYQESEIASIFRIRLLVYLFGSLILLAAIIGFLRIQFQLFRLRRREVSLRIVNGASRLKLFGLLVTEIAITLLLSVMVAAVLGYLLQDFLDRDLGEVMIRLKLVVNNIWLYCLAVGGGLLIICSGAMWIALSRLLKYGQGLASNMRRSRNHLFRHVMLCLQILISIIFVSATFTLWDGAKAIFKQYNIPENDDFYKECLVLRLSDAQQPQKLIDVIKKLPDLEKIVMFDHPYNPVKEVSDNPEIVEKLNGRIYFQSYFVTDTTMPSLFGMDVEWMNRDFDRNKCILVSEKLYKQLEELGVLDRNTLTPDFSMSVYGPLPIGGIIKNIPYDTDGKSLVAIYPSLDNMNTDFMLIPKPGKYNSLLRGVNDAISRIEPEIITKMVENFREFKNMGIPFVEAISTGGTILGVVSLIICAMSIFSAITLDTRARRKEVAVRKVNGAKSKDIYLLFGKVYLVILIIASVIAVPVCIMFNQMVGRSVVPSYTPEEDIPLSPASPVILAIVTVIILVVVIVGWQIHRVMQTDPAKVIAKE